MQGITVDGNDAVEVYETVSKAVKRARAKEGPTLVECKTYRWRGHHEGDPNQGERYRKKEDIEEWKKKDPIKRLADTLLEERIANKKELSAIERGVQAEIAQAEAFANESGFPPLEELYKDVYCDER